MDNIRDTHSLTKYITDPLSRGGDTKRRVGVVGLGMVGGAIAAYFKKKSNYELFVYDKYKDMGSIEEINNADFIYICVPTPHVEGVGCDTSIVEEIVDQIKGEKAIIIKSTIIPGAIYKLQEQYPQHAFLHNPEFLTEVTADQDMTYPDRQLIGYTDQSYGVAKEVLLQLPLAPYERILPAHITEFVKYFGNTWFSTKVSKNNEFYDLFKAYGGSDEEYTEMISTAAADKRIGRTHLKIVHKDKRGYSGSCLPKDTKAILELAEELGVDMPVLKATDAYNDKLLKSQGIKEV